MTDVLKIPANTRLRMMAIRDDAQDKFDVVGMEYDFRAGLTIPEPWAYWKMEEDGTNRIDATGHGHDLSEWGWTQYPERIAGKVGNAVQLTGIGVGPEATLRRLNESFTINPSQPFTIAGWFKTNQRGGIGPAYEYIRFIFWDFYSDTSAEITFRIDGCYAIYGTQELYIVAAVGMYVDTEEWIWGGLGCSTTPSSFSPTENEWHFYCLWYDGTGLYLEVDNVLVNQALGQHPAIGTASRVYLDISWNPGGGVVSAADELGVWTQALTADERTYLYNSGAGRTLYP